MTADEGVVPPSLPVNKKPVVKRPPASVPAALREFLIKKPDDEETDAPMPDAGASTKVPKVKLGSLPGVPEKKKAILKARSREPSKSRAQSRGRTQEPEGGSQRSRSRGDERKKPVGVLPSAISPASLPIGKKLRSSTVMRMSCQMTLPILVFLASSWIGLFVIFAGHGLMEKGHDSTCMLDFTCVSRGIGARVTRAALPHAQSAVTEHWLRDSVAGPATSTMVQKIS